MAYHGAAKERSAAVEPALTPAAVRLVSFLIIELGAVVLLHRLGADQATRIPWHHLGRWLATAPPEDAVWAVVRLAGLACAYWQLVATIAYVGARASRLPRLVAGVRWACLPGVRRLVDAALAASIVGSAVLSPTSAHASTPTTSPAPVVVQVGSAMAAGSPHAYQPVAAGDVAPSTAPSTSTTTTTARPAVVRTTVAEAPTTTVTPPPSPGTSLAPPASPGKALPPGSAQDLHEVVPGDNQWAIAAAHLAEVTGRPATALSEAEIRFYWVRLMAANTGRLRSGNPNLIFPGELVVCPPVQEAQG